jgi:DNA-binding transcriptional LysR family regulator
VAALEQALGLTLFERMATRLEVTQAGLDLLEHVRAMGEAALRISLTAAGQATRVEGTVAITASEAIAAYLLPPILGQLRVDHPGIEIELVASNQPRDLQRREADIAVRNFRPQQADLFARKIRDARGHFYASPSYIDRVGPFETPRDLRRAELFAFDRTQLMIDGFKAMGLDVDREQFPIMSANHLVQWQLCRQGVGVCMMMEEIGDAEPGVRRILPDLPSIPVPIWLVSHRELQTNRRIRLVFDRLADGLA